MHLANNIFLLTNREDESCVILMISGSVLNRKYIYVLKVPLTEQVVLVSTSNQQHITRLEHLYQFDFISSI